MPADTTTNKRFLGLEGTQALVAEIKKKININVLTTKGDILYASANEASSGAGASLDRLPIGSQGQVLKVTSGGIPGWFDEVDQKVSQTSTNTSGSYPVLFKNSANATNENQGVRYSSSVSINPSTNTITASNFSGSGASLSNLRPSNIVGVDSNDLISTAVLPSATASENGTGGTAGIVSALDMEHLTTMWNLWQGDNPENSIVDKVTEVLNAFAQFGEGDTIVGLLANKADASALNNYIPLAGTTALAGSIVPSTNSTSSSTGVSLGSSSKRLNYVYARELNGNQAVIKNAADESSVTITTDDDDDVILALYDGDEKHSTVYLRNTGAMKTIAFTSEIPTISLTTTTGSEAITLNGTTLSLVTRDTAQTISGAKTFTNNITIGNSASTASTDANFVPARTEKSDLGSSSKKFNNLFVKTIGAAATPVDSIYGKTYDIRNASGSQVATLTASGITLGAATSNNNTVISWDTLALISNGEISAADVQAMF